MTTQATRSAWRVLTRQDLPAFDNEAASIVLDASEMGWLGRISTKGHAIMRAPDGNTTISVSRDSSRGRSGKNARADLERWKNRQPGTAFGIDANTVSAEEEVELDRLSALSSRNPLARTYVKSLLDGGTDKEDLRERIAIIGDPSHPDQWVCMDTLTKEVFAWSDDLGPHEAMVIAYETMRLPIPGVPAVPAEPECPECHKTFVTPRALASHAKTHKPSVTCDVPGCTWQGSYIEAHLRRAHPVQERLSTSVENPVEGAPTPLSHFFPEKPKTDPVDAVLALVEEVQRLRIAAAETQALRDQLEWSQGELREMTAERDDLKARLELLRETLNL
jgi:hypothetical protein